MKITQFELENNYDMKAESALNDKIKASQALFVEEDNVRAGLGYNSLNYHKAYLNYAKTDTAHARYFLNLIKETHVQLLSMYNTKKEDKELEEDLFMLEDSFEKYYDICEELVDGENKIEEEINRYNCDDRRITTLEFLKLHEFVMEYDYKHLNLHNQLQDIANQTIVIIDSYYKKYGIEDFNDLIFKADDSEDPILN